VTCKEHFTITIRSLCAVTIRKLCLSQFFFYPLENLQCRRWISEENTLDLDFFEYCKNYTCIHYWFEPLNKGWYVACTMMNTIGRQDFEKKRCFCLVRIKNLHEKTADNYNLRYRNPEFIYLHFSMKKH